MKSAFRNTIFIAFAVVSMLILTAPANSVLTPVNNSNTFEANLINNTVGKVPPLLNTSIMNTLYGPGNYIRIDDSFDQLWTSQGGMANVVAKFAGNTETIGYYNGGLGPLNGGTFNPLFTVAGSQYAVAGSAPIPINALFRFGLRTSPAQGTVFLSSRNLDNADLLDHMVTFFIPSSGHYALAFEDLLRRGSDRDFNDAVFEVSGVTPVPEPKVYLILGSMLTVLFLIKRKFKRYSVAH